MRYRMKIILVGLLCLVVFAGVVSAALVDPVNRPKTNGDGICDGYSIGFKLEDNTQIVPNFLEDGTYCNAALTQCVYIDFYSTEGEGGRINAFNFNSATFDVEEVVVKAGVTENVYNYLGHDPPFLLTLGQITGCFHPKERISAIYGSV